MKYQQIATTSMLLLYISSARSTSVGFPQTLSRTAVSTDDNTNLDNATASDPPSDDTDDEYLDDEVSLDEDENKPMETLKKLQMMLDDTDYAVLPRGNATMAAVANNSNSNNKTIDKPRHKLSGDQQEEHNRKEKLPVEKEQPKKLWTSIDRNKYKRKQRQEKQKRMNEQMFSMSDEESEEAYILPNLPIYLSDAEEDEDDTDDAGSNIVGIDKSPLLEADGEIGESTQSISPDQISNTNYRQPIPHHHQQYPAQQYYPGQPYHPYQVPYPYPPAYYGQQQQQHQQTSSHQQNPYSPFPPTYYPPPPYGRPGLYPPAPPRSYNPYFYGSPHEFNSRATVIQQQSNIQGEAVISPTDNTDGSDEENSLALTQVEEVASLAEAGTKITFDSLQKIFFMVSGAMLLSYCAVSPRKLPLAEYNMKFKENLQLLVLPLIVPAITILSVLEIQQNDVNSMVDTFYSAFTIGYLVTFLLETVVATALRLLVFVFTEPDIFSLTPKVPVIILPWVLRENNYRPTRMTLFAADFTVSCIAAPIIEEFVKLKVMDWSVRLPRNFELKKVDKKSGKGKKKKLVKVIRNPGEEEITKINKHIVQMLVASIGLKLTDTIRRILMYTKPKDDSKVFYAACRGMFPIHELCGTMTALNLAKRDILGVKMPLWKMLLPAVIIHAMANFRGMKPIFKWNSSTPWSEMQLSPWNVADDSTLSQIISKGFAKLMWWAILARVLGYCIKNYYMVGRQALKRATTYAGKRAAFLSELAAAEMLKRSKKDG